MRPPLPLPLPLPFPLQEDSGSDPVNNYSSGGSFGELALM
jgi:hypothetical protein